jgi:1-acyl-sn-glycerol-3-phosphate acyltransferase
MVLFIPIGCIALILQALHIRPVHEALIHLASVAFGRSIIALVGCKVTVKGRENIPRKGGVCFVANHESFFDVVMLLAYSKRRIGFVAKKEFSYIPLLNLWILLVGGVFVDRKNPRRALRSIHKGAEKIKKGNAIMIFPEGTRSRGRGVLPFKTGAMKLAVLSEQPIVPVAITGAYHIYEEKGYAQKGPVYLTYLPPIDTASLAPEEKRNVLTEKVREKIINTINQSL